MSKLADAETVRLYGTLLSGLARHAQDRLCAADEQHDWGPWRRFHVAADAPVDWRPDVEPWQEPTLKTRSERACRNCGKFEQKDG